MCQGHNQTLQSEPAKASELCHCQAVPLDTISMVPLPAADFQVCVQVVPAGVAAAGVSCHNS